MPRSARIIIPGIAHHITQRGNNCQMILEEEEDFSRYCYWINQYSQKYRVSILAYCLMNNHVHFIVIPEDQKGIARLFSTAHMRYSQYMNVKRGTTGHVWQGRYFSCVLDEEHLFYAIRYVEQNPVRAQMVKLPWDYEWSSARGHVKKSTKKYIKIKDTSIVDSQYWKHYLISNDEGKEQEIRKKTRQGKAFANEKFIVCWEQKLNRVLSDLKPGRKKKK